MTCKKFIKETSHCSDFPDTRCIHVPLSQCKYIEVIEKKEVLA